MGTANIDVINTQRFEFKYPYDAEVEYLESTGIQYIDTEVQCTSDSGFYVDLMVLESTTDESYPSVIGAETTDWTIYYGVYEGGGYLYYGNSNGELEYNDALNNRMQFHINYLNEHVIRSSVGTTFTNTPP